MTQAIPAEILAQAPFIWRRNGVGVGVKVRDPNWIKARLENIAVEEREEERSACGDVWLPSEMTDEQFAIYSRGYRAAVEARLVPMCKRGGLSFTDIIYFASKKHGLSEADIKFKSRKPKLVKARQEMMWIAKNKCGMSFNRIAIYLGRINHTTVLHGVKMHQARLDAGEAFDDFR